MINREDLIQNHLSDETDDGHVRQIWPLYIRWFTLYLLVNGANSTAQFGEQGQIYARFVAETALCCVGAEALKLVTSVYGFCAGWVLNQWLTEEESLVRNRAACAGAIILLRRSLTQYFAAYSLGRLKWQVVRISPYRHISLSLKYDASGARDV